jgi:phenylalanyl-tRNA synthetase alpha chain
MLQSIINELHIYEKKVLKAIKDADGITTPEEVSHSQDLDIKQVMSAAGALSSKDIIKVEKDVQKFISLSNDGKSYAKEGLPERRILNSLKEDKHLSLKDITQKSGVNQNDVKIAIGWLMRKKWATMDKGIIKLTSGGEEALNSKYPDEELLEALLHESRLLVSNLTSNLKKGFESLKKRKGIIKIKEESNYTFKITPKGREILDIGFEIKKEATQLTHKQLKTGSWKSLQYRGYDVNAEYPEVYPGKIHPLQRIIEEVRNIFIKLGFKESKGTILESAFWNFDCLFQPQDHAAREMQDTF